MQRHPRARTPEGAQPAAAPGGGATRSVANPITTRPSQRLSAEDNYVVGELEEEGDLASVGKSSYGTDQTFALDVFAFDEAQITHPENRATVSPAAPAPSITKNSRLRVAGGLRPRRLTPRECERLQGFPDDYTLIPGASDSARYMALGNSMATPVMTWIGRRLLAVDAILNNQTEQSSQH